MCPMCNGDRPDWLGRLSNTDHYRCRSCGWIFRGGKDGEYRQERKEQQNA